MTTCAVDDALLTQLWVLRGALSQVTPHDDDDDVATGVLRQHSEQAMRAVADALLLQAQAHAGEGDTSRTTLRCEDSRSRSNNEAVQQALCRCLAQLCDALQVRNSVVAGDDEGGVGDDGAACGAASMAAAACAYERVVCTAHDVQALLASHASRGSGGDDDADDSRARSEADGGGAVRRGARSGGSASAALDEARRVLQQLAERLRAQRDASSSSGSTTHRNSSDGGVVSRMQSGDGARGVAQQPSLPYTAVATLPSSYATWCGALQRRVRRIVDDARAAQHEVAAVLRDGVYGNAALASALRCSDNSTTTTRQQQCRDDDDDDCSAWPLLLQWCDDALRAQRCAQVLCFLWRLHVQLRSCSAAQPLFSAHAQLCDGEHGGGASTHDDHSSGGDATTRVCVTVDADVRRMDDAVLALLRRDVVQQCLHASQAACATSVRALLQSGSDEARGERAGVVRAALRGAVTCDAPLATQQARTSGTASAAAQRAHRHGSSAKRSTQASRTMARGSDSDGSVAAARRDDGDEAAVQQQHALCGRDDDEDATLCAVRRLLDEVCGMAVQHARTLSTGLRDVTLSSSTAWAAEACASSRHDSVRDSGSNSNTRMTAAAAAAAHEAMRDARYAACYAWYDVTRIVPGGVVQLRLDALQRRAAQRLRAAAVASAPREECRGSDDDDVNTASVQATAEATRRVDWAQLLGDTTTMTAAGDGGGDDAAEALRVRLAHRVVSPQTRTRYDGGMNVEKHVAMLLAEQRKQAVVVALPSSLPACLAHDTAPLRTSTTHYTSPHHTTGNSSSRAHASRYATTTAGDDSSSTTTTTGGSAASREWWAMSGCKSGSSSRQHAAAASSCSDDAHDAAASTSVTSDMTAAAAAPLPRTDEAHARSTTRYGSSSGSEHAAVTTTAPHATSQSSSQAPAVPVRRDAHSGEQAAHDDDSGGGNDDATAAAAVHNRRTSAARRDSGDSSARGDDSNSGCAAAAAAGVTCVGEVKAQYAFLHDEPCAGVYLDDVDVAHDMRFRTAVNRLTVARSNAAAAAATTATPASSSHSSSSGSASASVADARALVAQYEDEVNAVVASLARELRQRTLEAHARMPFLDVRTAGVLLGTLVPHLEDDSRFMALASLRQQMIRGAAGARDHNRQRLLSTERCLREQAELIAHTAMTSANGDSSSSSGGGMRAADRGSLQPLPCVRDAARVAASTAALRAAAAEYALHEQQRLRAAATAAAAAASASESHEAQQASATAASSSCGAAVHTDTDTHSAHTPSHHALHNNSNDDDESARNDKAATTLDTTADVTEATASCMTTMTTTTTTTDDDRATEAHARTALPTLSLLSTELQPRWATSTPSTRVPSTAAYMRARAAPRSNVSTPQSLSAATTTTTTAATTTTTSTAATRAMPPASADAAQYNGRVAVTAAATGTMAMRAANTSTARTTAAAATTTTTTLPAVAQTSSVPVTTRNTPLHTPLPRCSNSNNSSSSSERYGYAVNDTPYNKPAARTHGSRSDATGGASRNNNDVQQQSTRTSQRHRVVDDDDDSSDDNDHKRRTAATRAGDGGGAYARVHDTHNNNSSHKSAASEHDSCAATTPPAAAAAAESSVECVSRATTPSLFVADLSVSQTTLASATPTHAAPPPLTLSASTRQAATAAAALDERTAHASRTTAMQQQQQHREQQSYAMHDRNHDDGDYKATSATAAATTAHADGGTTRPSHHQAHRCSYDDVDHGDDKVAVTRTRACDVGDTRSLSQQQQQQQQQQSVIEAWMTRCRDMAGQARLSERPNSQPTSNDNSSSNNSSNSSSGAATAAAFAASLPHTWATKTTATMANERAARGAATATDEQQQLQRANLLSASAASAPVMSSHAMNTTTDLPQTAHASRTALPYAALPPRHGTQPQSTATAAGARATSNNNNNKSSAAAAVAAAHREMDLYATLFASHTRTSHSNADDHHHNNDTSSGSDRKRHARASACNDNDNNDNKGEREDAGATRSCSPYTQLLRRQQHEQQQRGTPLESRLDFLQRRRNGSNAQQQQQQQTPTSPASVSAVSSTLGNVVSAFASHSPSYATAAAATPPTSPRTYAAYTALQQQQPSSRSPSPALYSATWTPTRRDDDADRGRNNNNNSNNSNSNAATGTRRLPLSWPPDTALRSVYTHACAELHTRANSGLLLSFPARPAVWLDRLDLSVNYVGVRGFRPVLYVLEHNGRHLEVLNLSNNNLENSEVLELLDVLAGPAGERLCALDLSYNPVSQTGGQALLRYSATHSALCTLNLKGTLIPPRLVHAIEDVVEEHAYRKHIGQL